MKSLNEMEELKRFQGSTFDTFSRRTLVEDRDTIFEFTGKIQELQNEVNCMNDSRDFQDAESERSGRSHVPSQPAFFPPFRNPGGMLCRSLGMPSRNNGPPSLWDAHGSAGKTFLKIQSRWPCKDHLKGTCTNSFCEKWHPPERLFYKSENGCRFGKSALLRIARLKNSQAKGPKKWSQKCSGYVEEE